MVLALLNLHVDIVKCKRLGRPVPGIIQPVLATGAVIGGRERWIMRNAKQLRNSNNIVVRENIYINRHLIAAQSRAAYAVNDDSLLSNVLHVNSHLNHCRQHRHHQQQQQRSRIWPTIMYKCHCHFLMLKVSCLTTCLAWSLNRVQPLTSLLLLVLHSNTDLSVFIASYSSCFHTWELTNRLWGRFASSSWIVIIKLLSN